MEPHLPNKLGCSLKCLSPGCAPGGSDSVTFVGVPGMWILTKNMSMDHWPSILHTASWPKTQICQAYPSLWWLHCPVPSGACSARSLRDPHHRALHLNACGLFTREPVPNSGLAARRSKINTRDKWWWEKKVCFIREAGKMVDCCLKGLLPCLEESQRVLKKKKWVEGGGWGQESQASRWIVIPRYDPQQKRWHRWPLF